MTRKTQKRFTASLLCTAILLATSFNLARADSACRYTEQASLALSHPAGSTMPMVAGEINGTPVSMLLDTGSDATYVLRAEADRQNLHPERTSRQVQGVGGRTSLFLVKVKDFAIGGAHATNMRFPVVDSMAEFGMAGIVGDDFLLQYDVELDFTEKHVKLFRPDHCQDKALAYWDKDASSVPMKFARGSTKPLVQVQINGVALWALIDTGADSTVVDLAVARTLGFSSEAPGVLATGSARGIGDQTRAIWQHHFDSFAIGDERIEHARIGVIDSPTDLIGRQEHQVILGRDFLRSHHVLLAQSQMQFYFSYLGGAVFQNEPVAQAAL